MMHGGSGNERAVERWRWRSLWRESMCV